MCFLPAPRYVGDGFTADLKRRTENRCIPDPGAGAELFGANIFAPNVLPA